MSNQGAAMGRESPLAAPFFMIACNGEMNMIIAQPHLYVGCRAKVHPATDLFMRGVRYVTVQKIGRKWVHVTGDPMGGDAYKFKIAHANLERI